MSKGLRKDGVLDQYKMIQTMRSSYSKTKNGFRIPKYSCIWRHLLARVCSVLLGFGTFSLPSKS